MKASHINILRENWVGECIISFLKIEMPSAWRRAYSPWDTDLISTVLGILSSRDHPALLLLTCDLNKVLTRVDLPRPLWPDGEKGLMVIKRPEKDAVGVLLHGTRGRDGKLGFILEKIWTINVCWSLLLMRDERRIGVCVWDLTQRLKTAVECTLSSVSFFDVVLSSQDQVSYFTTS